MDFPAAGSVEDILVAVAIQAVVAVIRAVVAVIRAVVAVIREAAEVIPADRAAEIAVTHRRTSR